MAHTGDRRWFRRVFPSRPSRRSLAGYVILLAGALLLFALSVVIHVNADNLAESFAWTQNTDDVLLETASVRDDLFEMQSAVRAYALTGDKRYALGLTQHEQSLQAGLRRLTALVSDNPDQARRLAALRQLVETRVSHLASFMGLSAAQRQRVALGGAEVDALLVPPASLTGRIEAGFAGFRVVEQDLLKQRQARARRETDLFSILSFALALMAPVLGAVGILLLWDEEMKGRAAELVAQFSQAQRLSLMGETASMLAHEVKQPLTAAKNYLGALARTGPSERQGEIMRRLGEQVERADAIIQRLRGLVENSPVARERVRPGALAADAVLLARTIDGQVALRTQVEERLAELQADPIQIQQVLVNLMRNAIEAMAGRERRDLSLTVSRHADGMILFSLADTGPGLAPQVAARLFQAGQSTKPDGMGIGLSICRKIVTAHGGEIWAEPGAEGGAIFCFTLPALGARAQEAEAA